MKKLRVTLDIKIDDVWYDETKPGEEEWYLNEVLVDGDLVVFSQELGDVLASAEETTLVSKEWVD